MTAAIRLSFTNGERKIFVNDQDISGKVEAVYLTAEGTQPVLGLRLVPDFTFEGEGIVQIREDIGDPRELMLEFLNAIDPQTLAEEALANLDADTDPITAALGVLKGYLTDAT